MVRSLSILCACAVTSAVLADGMYSNAGFAPEVGPRLDTVKSSKFKILWNSGLRKTGAAEEFMSVPVLYDDGKGLLIGSSTNKIYSVKAKTGAVIASRQLRPNSFACADMKYGVGILGSPILDDHGRTAWVYTKGPDGYYLHSFDTSTLKERPRFPVHVDGPSTDNPELRFNSTMFLQRPALSLLNDVIYGAFGGGCGDHNTIVAGWVVGVHSKTGEIVSRWSTGGGSIWHAGAPLSTDRSDRLFLATADGDGKSSYEGAAIRFKLSRSSGRISPDDTFRPWNYTVMDQSQRDLGAAGVALTNFVLQGRKTAVVGGKNGIIHVLDREDLGGYSSDGGGNRILQEFAVPEVNPGTRGRLFIGFGSWPRRRGGYLYARPLDLNSTLVYSFDERRGFKLAGRSEEDSVTLLGSGAPIVTTDLRGEGIVWVVDAEKGLLAWNAIPEGGKLVSIALPRVAIGGSDGWTYKFQRPVFGSGRVYVASREGGLLSYGSASQGL